MRRTWVTVFLSLSVVSVACTKPPPQPKAGDTCAKNDSTVCIDKVSQLTCTNGVYMLDHCKSCDVAANKGVGCAPAGDGEEASECTRESYDCTDSVTEVVCIDRQYRHFRCKGPGGCSHDDKGVTCDHSVAEPKERCRSGSACTLDHNSRLECRQGLWVVASSCRGPLHCGYKEDKLVCDTTLAVAGDVCDTGSGGCSPDGQYLLLCNKETSRFRIAQHCRGKAGGCQTKERWTGCADPYAGAVGDPCTENGHACTEDGKGLLECKDGAYVLKKACGVCKGNDPDKGQISCKDA